LQITIFLLVKRKYLPEEPAMSNSSSPRLAPPGQGLPALENRIARLRLAWSLRHRSRDWADQAFESERARIASLVHSVDPAWRAERVLIRRVRGLEDSSRNWSVWMVLDHLRICHGVFSGIVARLAAGEVPQVQASIAAVKPSPEAGASVEVDHETSCDHWLETVRSVPDLHTAERYAHPWFGPLDAAGWQRLTAMHLGIHRRQLERIIRGLSPGPR
jgi:hypothetical protein